MRSLQSLINEDIIFQYILSNCFVTNSTLTISTLTTIRMYKDINPFFMDITPNEVIFYITNNGFAHKNIIPISDFYDKDLILMTLEIENGSCLHGIHTELFELFLEHLRDIKENQS